jgi:hypothetical protein
MLSGICLRESQQKAEEYGEPIFQAGIMINLAD